MRPIPIAHIIRSARRTVALEITREGHLVIRAPHRAKMADIHQLVQQKRQWIQRKQTELRNQALRLPVYKIEPGSKVPYQGQDFTVKVTHQIAPVRLNAHTLLFNQIAARQMRASLSQWYVQEAKKWLFPKIQYWATQAQANIRQVKWSNAGHRWGSCSSKGTLNLNWRLILLPPVVADYIIVHEVTHLHHLNHSAAFWQEVEHLLPTYQESERWLKQYGLRYFF